MKKKTVETKAAPPEKWHSTEIGGVLSALGSDSEKGLSESGVKASRARGVNTLTEKKRKSVFIRVLEELTEPMMLILLAALVITVSVNAVTAVRGGGFDFTEVVGILIAIVASVTISLVMEGKSSKAFDALKKEARAITVKTVRGGRVMKLPAEQLVAGDIALLETGDKAAADMRIISCDGFEVDESPLTGESNPVKKHAGKSNTSRRLPRERTWSTAVVS